MEVVLDSMETLRRITSAVRFVERIKGSANLQSVPLPTSFGPFVCVVEVTDPDPSIDGYYIGQVVFKNTEDTSDIWEVEDDEIDGIRICGLNDEVLEVGKRYLGINVGRILIDPEGSPSSDNDYPLIIVVVPVEGAGGGSTITVAEVDGTPSFTSIGEVRFDQADGFVVSLVSAGIARVDMVMVPTITVSEVDGSPIQTGISEVRFDQADGFVVSLVSAGIARVDMQEAAQFQAGIVSIGTQIFGGEKTFALSGGATTLTIGVTGSVGAIFASSIALKLDGVNDRLINKSFSGSSTRYAIEDNVGTIKNGIYTTFTNGDGNIVTVSGGIITDISQP